MQARILSFLDMPSLVRLGSVSHGLAAATNEDGLWREVLQHQFDVRGQHADCKALVKNLHCGVACGWEGMCLDSSTALWLPIPLLMSGTEVVTNIGELDVPSDALLVPETLHPVATGARAATCGTPRQLTSFPSSAPSLSAHHSNDNEVEHSPPVGSERPHGSTCRAASSSVLTATCHRRSSKTVTKMVAKLYPCGVGLGKAQFACDVSGRQARWLTLRETGWGDGPGPGYRPTNLEDERKITYWGILMGSVFLGRYVTGARDGGAVCLFMQEVGNIACIQRAIHSPRQPCVDEVRVLDDGEEFQGIIAWPSAAERQGVSARRASASANLIDGDHAESLGDRKWFSEKYIQAAASETVESPTFLCVLIHSIKVASHPAEGSGEREGTKQSSTTCRLVITKAPKGSSGPMQTACAPHYGEAREALRQRRVRTASSYDDDWERWASAGIEEANNLRRGEVEQSWIWAGGTSTGVRREGGRGLEGEQLSLLMQSEASAEKLGQVVTLQAVEALDRHGQRHALGNLFCGALDPLSIHGQALLPPVSITLMRRGSMLGGVMRDIKNSASLVLFQRRQAAVCG